jgi:hypothetical protein
MKKQGFKNLAKIYDLKTFLAAFMAFGGKKRDEL